MSGVRFGDMTFHCIGYWRQGITLTIRIERRLVGPTDQFGHLLQPPGSTAAALELTNAARGQQPTTPPARDQHAEAIAVDHPSALVRNFIRGCRQFQLAVYSAAKTQQ